MANYKSFVFGATDDSQSWVTPSQGRYHLYVNDQGQLQVINHLGEVIPQNVSMTSIDAFASIQMIPQTELPPAQLGLIIYSANSGLLICNGTGSTGWTNFYTQHDTTFP